MSCSVSFCRKRKSLCHKVFYFKDLIFEDQKAKWIAALKNMNPDGTPWLPRENDFICNRHFIQEHYDEDPGSPDYAPTVYLDERSKKPNLASLARYLRWKRREYQEVPIPATELEQEPTPVLHATRQARQGRQYHQQNLRWRRRRASVLNYRQGNHSNTRSRPSEPNIPMPVHEPGSPQIDIDEDHEGQWLRITNLAPKLDAQGLPLPYGINILLHNNIHFDLSVA